MLKPFLKSFNEQLITKLFLENNIEFEQQKKFDWLGRQTLDFYLPQYNCCIEIDGEGHEKPTRFNGMDKDKAQLLAARAKVQAYINGKINIEQICAQYNILTTKKGYKKSSYSQRNAE